MQRTTTSTNVVPILLLGLLPWITARQAPRIGVSRGTAPKQSPGAW